MLVEKKLVNSDIVQIILQICDSNCQSSCRKCLAHFNQKNFETSSTSLQNTEESIVYVKRYESQELNSTFSVGVINKINIGTSLTSEVQYSHFDGKSSQDHMQTLTSPIDRVSP